MNLEALARRKAKKYGIDPDIFSRQIGAESGFDPNISSPAGAQGVAQIMPATAKAWGVDPLDPDAALDAAARNMAKYIQQYGGWENALRAYNAGPGAIQKSKQYDETNNYVKKILQGQSPDASRVNVSHNESRLGDVPGSTLDTPQTPSVFDVIRRLNGGDDTEDEQSPAEMIGATVERLKSLSAPQPQGPTSPTDSRSTAYPSKSTGEAEIKELFYDPMGGWKGEKDIGAIGGHEHVHVAGSDPRRTRWILKQAKKRFGLNVREHPDFDPVDPVHTKNSEHYAANAGDVSGKDEDERSFVNWLRKKYGF